jgi:uncharacterized membrane protein (GlpM family)
MYAPMLPVGLLIGLLGIGFDYWVSKYLLLRRYTRPSRLSASLSNSMMHFIPVTVFLYSLMNYVFNEVMDSDAAYAALVVLWIMLVLMFLPIGTIFKCCIK